MEISRGIPCASLRQRYCGLLIHLPEILARRRKLTGFASVGSIRQELLLQYLEMFSSKYLHPLSNSRCLHGSSGTLRSSTLLTSNLLRTLLATLIILFSGVQCWNGHDKGRSRTRNSERLLATIASCNRLARHHGGSQKHKKRPSCIYSILIM